MPRLPVRNFLYRKHSLAVDGVTARSYNCLVLPPIPATKLYIPSSRTGIVLRPHLIEQLNQGLHRQVTLVSAPAGFGKTTLVAEWVAACERPVAWLSLDREDNDPTRFLAYLIAALQTVSVNIGNRTMSLLQTPQPPPVEWILTNLLNEISAVPENFILVLDDYHVIDSKPVASALNFLLAHLPVQMHLVIVTRQDPDLPLSQLRVRDQLTELRAADLRFTLDEAASFLNQVMGMHLPAEHIAVLETRTEGWIAGLQLAAISMRGHQDAASFIRSFTGSHRFVMDYLVEQVLQQQPEHIQTFLLQTSILDRLCGSLCDAVMLAPAGLGQETLEYLERANLFVVPLDDERRWYRYHHLFAELLRQRLHQTIAPLKQEAETRVNELHMRASWWYQDNGFDLEAFQHAAAANDIERAQQLIDGATIPLHFRGAVTPILDWLDSLPETALNARPSLWWRHASLLLVNGQTARVPEKLDAAEAAIAAALQGAEPDARTRNLIGQIAVARATWALTRYDVETMLAQSHRALEYLEPDSVVTRPTAYWTLGYAHILRKDRVSARRALSESIALSTKSGAVFTTILATIGLALVQEAENELYKAADTYRHVLQLAGDQPMQIINEAHLGLARILYEWNDLDAAEKHAQQSLQLARQYEQVIDRFILGEVFLARLKLARGDVSAATAILSEANLSARRQNFVHRIPEVAAAQVQTLLRRGNLAAAAQLAQTHDLPFHMAQVHLARRNTAAALAVLEQLYEQAQAKGWHDESLRVTVLLALALEAHDEHDKALQHLTNALKLAEPGGFIRLFVDCGAPMARLLSQASAQGIMPDYIGKLLASFKQEIQAQRLAPDLQKSEASQVPNKPNQPLNEPLSQRELEILKLIARGLSNQEIAKQLFLALSTVKGHNRSIFDKLQVKSRTEAVAHARELGLV